jgi:hypothetical protein
MLISFYLPPIIFNKAYKFPEVFFFYYFRKFSQSTTWRCIRLREPLTSIEIERIINEIKNNKL